ncbi:hypothetical protein PG993_014576 [Apiospora rasikravindrae]|uniref:Centromere protein Scm3 n=1 Tax=Apiospora rasikravindrae TaxID=990691 RepID=A0ABR1RNH6_9PEZI
MEPPAKRHKVGQPPRDDPHNEANDDELSLHPGEFDARQDPLYELDKSRAKAVFKLKSRFESIFDKYERDFDGEGDEINLHTGEVIVNNGHLQSLEDEQDKEDRSADEEEEERLLQGNKPPSTSTSSTSGHSTPNHAALQLQNNWAPPPIFNTGLPSFSGLSTIPAQHYGMPHPFAPFGAAPVDPMWQTPELQMGGPQGHLGLFWEPISWTNEPLSKWLWRRIATAAELAVRNRQDAFLGEELAEEEGNEEDGLLGVSKEGGRSKHLLPDSSKQKTQEHNSISSATTSKGHFPKDDPIKKGGATITENATSESNRMPRVSDKAQVEDVTSAGSSECQAQQEEHSISRNKGVQHVEITENGHIPKHSSSFVIELRSAPGGVIPQKQVIAKKTRKDAPLQEVEEDIAGGSQGRRSGRPRAKPEFYGDVSWLKTRRPKPDMETILDSDPNEESHTRLEESDDLPDVDMAFADLLNDTNSMTEVVLDTLEDLQPGDVGNKAFIEAAESIFLSRSNDVSESPELADEPTLDRPPELQSQTTVGSEPAKTTQQAESFSRNYIDPSYNFSDDEDESGVPELPKLPVEAEPGPRKGSETEGLGLAVPNRNNGIAKIPEAQDIIEISANQNEEVPPVESPSTTTTVGTSEFSRIPVSEAASGETVNVVSHKVGDENARAMSREILVDRTTIVADNAADRGATKPRRRPLANSAAASPRTPTKKTKKRSLNDDGASGRGEKTKTTKPTTTAFETKRLTSSAKKHALASLIPDNSDDEDEISILAHTPTSSRHAEAPFSSSPLRNNATEPLTPSHRGARNRSTLGSSAAARRSGSRYAPATDSRALGGRSSSAAGRRSSKADYRSTAAKAKTTAFSSPLLQRVLKTPRTARRYHHLSFPEEEGLVRTPGGTMRRCGVDGFLKNGALKEQFGRYPKFEL